jgi:hypothetical protein
MAEAGKEDQVGADEEKRKFPDLGEGQTSR